METKAPWQLVGEEFVRQYYQVFDTNREQVVGLYAVRILPNFAQPRIVIPGCYLSTHCKTVSNSMTTFPD